MVVVLKKLGGKQRAQGLWLWSLFIIIHWRSLEEWYAIKTICSPQSLSSHTTEFRANGPAIGPLVAGEGDPAADDHDSVPCRPRGPHGRGGLVSEGSRAHKSRGQAGRVGNEAMWSLPTGKRINHGSFATDISSR